MSELNCERSFFLEKKIVRILTSKVITEKIGTTLGRSNCGELLKTLFFHCLQVQSDLPSYIRIFLLSS